MVSPIFEIHLEDWHDALHICDRGHSSRTVLWWLISLLVEHDVHATIYTLEKYRSFYKSMFEELESRGWTIKSHGVHHHYDEKADRSPYFNQEGIPLPPSGGFFFRIMPLWYLRWAIKKSGLFWIHPHDLDETHPKIKNPFLNWKRHVGLKGAKAKLEKLLQEVKFE